MKYVIGDQAKIREDLIIGNQYGEYNFTDAMKSYIGEIVTITQVNTNYYIIGEDVYKSCWTDEMFERRIL